MMRSIPLGLTASFLLLGFLLLSACSSDSDDGDTGGATDGEVAWTEAQSGDQWWLSVHIRAKDDQWVVGGVPDAGRILHYDGTEWATVDPKLDKPAPLLNWVHGFGATGGLYVVGDGGTALRMENEVWTLEDTPTDENLWGVWGASEADLFAVGGSGRSPSQATILRRQSGVWTSLNVGTGLDVDPGRPTRAFFKVWGSSANDVWVVGQNGAIVHFDGTTWKSYGAGTADDLIAVWGTGPNNVVAVGGRNNGIAALWDGSTWTLVDTEFEFDPGINGVWTQGDTIHLAAQQGTMFTLSGASKKKSDTRELMTTVDMHAVHSADGVITTVGGNFLFAEGPYEGAIFTRELGDAE